MQRLASLEFFFWTSLWKSCKFQLLSSGVLETLFWNPANHRLDRAITERWDDFSWWSSSFFLMIFTVIFMMIYFRTHAWDSFEVINFSSTKIILPKCEFSKFPILSFKFSVSNFRKTRSSSKVNNSKGLCRIAITHFPSSVHQFSSWVARGQCE